MSLLFLCFRFFNNNTKITHTSTWTRELTHTHTHTRRQTHSRIVHTVFFFGFVSWCMSWAWDMSAPNSDESSCATIQSVGRSNRGTRPNGRMLSKNLSIGSVRSDQSRRSSSLICCVEIAMTHARWPWCDDARNGPKNVRIGIAVLDSLHHTANSSSISKWKCVHVCVSECVCTSSMFVPPLSCASNKLLD